MKILGGIIAALAVVGALAFGGISLIGDQLEDSASSLKADALNSIVDATGIKETVQNELDSHIEDIASLAGVSPSEARSAIDSLAIESWNVTDAPENAVETSTYSTAAAGVDANITLYDDPSYVTVEMYGQSLTFDVPESAQDYTAFFSNFS